MKLIITIAALLSLSGCITLNYTLKDGTSVAVDGKTFRLEKPDGSGNKGVVEFELPKRNK